MLVPPTTAAAAKVTENAMNDLDREGWSERASDGRRGSLLVHLPVMHRVAERILGCRDLARDAVQEALLTHWRGGPDDGSDRAWLIRTVIHRSLHERRAQSRRRRWESDAARDGTFDCPLCQPDRELERRELASLLDGALRSLPEAHRTVFLLREVDGLEYHAIALRLGLPVGTVRSRLNRARCALRAYLQREFANDAID